MDGLRARLNSFKKSKRVKNPNKSSSTKSLKWPHTLEFTANPETLAEAGFYYDPSYDDPDSVTCFNCEKQLAGWEEDDDPHLIHWNKCAQTCCWANVQCGLKVDVDRSGRFVFPDKTRLPNHKTMEKARLETFTLGKGWVHDKTKNHGATSTMMARAGFVYTPQETGDDLATCLYCNVSLSGWDEGDDPMEEHRKRATKSKTSCPFFEQAESRQTKPSKSSSRSTSKPPSRSISTVLIPTKTYDGELEDESDVPQGQPKSSAKTPAKSRSRSSAKTPRTKSRSASRSGLKDLAEEVEDAENATETPTVKKRTRAASKSVVAHSDVEEEVKRLVDPPTVRKTTRSRAKSKAPVDQDDETGKIRKSSRSKSKVAATKTTTTEIRTQSQPLNPDVKALFNDDIIVMDEYVPPPSSPPSTQQATTDELFIPRWTKDKGNALLGVSSKDLEVTPTASNDHGAGNENLKKNRPTKGKATSEDKRKQANKVVEVSSDEEEVEGKEPPSNDTKTRSIEPVKTSSLPSLPPVNEFKNSELRSLEKDQPVENPMDVSMHDAEPGIQEIVTHQERELHSAPTTPPRLLSHEEDPSHAGHFDAPQSVLQTSNDRSEDPQPMTIKLATEPLYLPPLSRLPFMPLQTLTEAELDMTVEEWIRYQIEVEQDRFKRDGERELERFKKRAEEVRKVIESL